MEIVSEIVYSHTALSLIYYIQADDEFMIQAGAVWYGAIAWEPLDTCVVLAAAWPALRCLGPRSMESEITLILIVIPY